MNVKQKSRMKQLKEKMNRNGQTRVIISRKGLSQKNARSGLFFFFTVSIFLWGLGTNCWRYGTQILNSMGTI